MLCKGKGMPKVTINSRLEALRKRYAQDYDLSTLNNSNDKATLETILRNSIILEDLQQRQLELMEGDISSSAAEIKKIGDLIKATAETNLSLERSLGIDRKSRKVEDNAESPAAYIASLKLMAREFLEKRLIRLYCPQCNVMVLRFSPVHDHTKFNISIRCSQCGKSVIAKREDRDIFYDLKSSDREWRRKYPVEIEAAKKDSSDDIDSEDDEMILG